MKYKCILNRVMEAGTISRLLSVAEVKTRAIPKSHKSRGNFLIICALALAFCGITNKVMGQTWNIGYPIATDVTATLNNGTLTISGTGAMKDWRSTGSQNWYSVKNNITSVFINSGITTIGRIAFENCFNLTSVSIPNTVKTIEEWAFAHCHSLTSITIPNSVETLESGVFEDCRNLVTVIIGNNVEKIGNYTFKTCNRLASVTIPNTVTFIGFEAFCNCTDLTNLTVNWITPLSIDGSVFSGVSTSKVKLQVPLEAQHEYANAPIWQNFNLVVSSSSSRTNDQVVEKDVSTNTQNKVEEDLSTNTQNKIKEDLPTNTQNKKAGAPILSILLLMSSGAIIFFFIYFQKKLFPRIIKWGTKKEGKLLQDFERNINNYDFTKRIIACDFISNDKNAKKMLDINDGLKNSFTVGIWLNYQKRMIALRENRDTIDVINIPFDKIQNYEILEDGYTKFSGGAVGYEGITIGGARSKEISTGLQIRIVAGDINTGTHAYIVKLFDPIVKSWYNINNANKSSPFYKATQECARSIADEIENILRHIG